MRVIAHCAHACDTYSKVASCQLIRPMHTLGCLNQTPAADTMWHARLYYYGCVTLSYVAYHSSNEIVLCFWRVFFWVSHRRSCSVVRADMIVGDVRMGMELHSQLSEGIVWYTGMQDSINKLKQMCSDFVMTRNIDKQERESVVARQHEVRPLWLAVLAFFAKGTLFVLFLQLAPCRALCVSNNSIIAATRRAVYYKLTHYAPPSLFLPTYFSRCVQNKRANLANEEAAKRLQQMDINTTGATNVTSAPSAAMHAAHASPQQYPAPPIGPAVPSASPYSAYPAAPMPAAAPPGQQMYPQYGGAPPGQQPSPPHNPYAAVPPPAPYGPAPPQAQVPYGQQPSYYQAQSYPQGSYGQQGQPHR